MAKKKKQNGSDDSIFNPNQLVTIEEAREIAAMISFCGGIAREVPSADANNDDDYHNTVSGIYLEPWSNPTGTTPEPRIGDSRPFLFRFNPTPEGYMPSGFNIGLTRQTAIGHAPPPEKEGGDPNPPNWKYALESLEREVTEQIERFKASL
jgi:hypothetical protein